MSELLSVPKIDGDYRFLWFFKNIICFVLEVDCDGAVYFMA